MFPILSFAGSMGISLGLDGVAGVQHANQERMALANGVTGNESPEQIVGLAQADKAASLKAAVSGIKADYGDAWAEQSKRMHKKNMERMQRLNFMA
ncbi:MAG TPA: hypothetical protein V6C52_03240 [Coleofasciculaceae cyanobacterium]|jgi:hypothetical protein